MALCITIALTALGGCETNIVDDTDAHADIGDTFTQPLLHPTVSTHTPTELPSSVVDEPLAILETSVEVVPDPSVEADETFHLEDFNEISEYVYADISTQPDSVYTSWLPGWFESSNLPVLIIDTDGLEIQDEPKQPASLQIWDNGEGRNNPDDPPTSLHTIGVEIRGQSSKSFPKPGLGIEFWEPYSHNGDEGYIDTDVSLLGMPAEEDWALYGPYVDNSLMRNAIAYTLGGSVTGRYTPRHRFVELFFSENKTNPLRFDNYYGVYLVTEKIKRDDNRVDISKRSYLLELTPPEKVDDHDLSLRHGSHYITIKYPKAEDIEVSAIEQLDLLLANLNTAMYADDFDDKQTGFLAYMDLDTVADFVLLNEFLKNRDGLYASTFFTWSPGEKIKAGPLWDFNTAMSRTANEEHDLPEGWMLPLRNTWGRRMMESDVFTQRMADRWHELRHGPLSDAQLVRVLETYRAELSEAQERNFAGFPNKLGKYKYPYEATWEDAVDRLATWLIDRAKWLDENIDEGLPFIYDPSNPENVGQSLGNPSRVTKP